MMRLLAIVPAVLLAGCSIFETRPRDFSSALLEIEPNPPATGAERFGTDPAELPDSLTLEKALEIAWASSPSLHASFQRIEAARARLSQAWSGYLPAVQAGVGAQRTLESNLPPSFSFPGFKPPDDYWTYSTSLAVSWLLFDGLGREYRLAQARASEDESKAAFEELRRLLSRGVGAAYFSVLLAKEQLAVTEEDLAFNRTMLDDARKRKEAGMGSEADVLSFTVRANSSESARIAAEANLRTQRLALAEVLGIRGAYWPARVRLSPPPEEAVAKTTDAASLLRDAMASRPDLAQALKAVDRSDAGVGAAWGDFFPSASASLSAGHQRKDDAVFSFHDLSAQAGFSLSWTLFGGGSRFASLRASRAEAKAARAEVERLRRAVAREVLQASSALEEARKKLRLSRENAELSRRLRDMEATAFARGATSRSQLDQVQTEFTRALLGQAMGSIELRMARFNLDIAAGKVSAR